MGTSLSNDDLLKGRYKLKNDEKIEKEKQQQDNNTTINSLEKSVKLLDSQSTTTQNLNSKPQSRNDIDKSTTNSVPRSLIMENDSRLSNNSKDIPPLRAGVHSRTGSSSEADFSKKPFDENDIMFSSAKTQPPNTK